MGKGGVTEHAASDFRPSPSFVVPLRMRALNLRLDSSLRGAFRPGVRDIGEL